MAMLNFHGLAEVPICQIFIIYIYKIIIYISLGLQINKSLLMINTLLFITWFIGKNTLGFNYKKKLLFKNLFILN